MSLGALLEVPLTFEPSVGLGTSPRFRGRETDRDYPCLVKETDLSVGGHWTYVTSDLCPCLP